MDEILCSWRFYVQSQIFNHSIFALLRPSTFPQLSALRFYIQHPQPYMNPVWFTIFLISGALSSRQLLNSPWPMSGNEGTWLPCTQDVNSPARNACVLHHELLCQLWAGQLQWGAAEALHRGEVLTNSSDTLLNFALSTPKIKQQCICLAFQKYLKLKRLPNNTSNAYTMRHWSLMLSKLDRSHNTQDKSMGVTPVFLLAAPGDSNSLHRTYWWGWQELKFTSSD